MTIRRLTSQTALVKDKKDATIYYKNHVISSVSEILDVHRSSSRFNTVLKKKKKLFKLITIMVRDIIFEVLRNILWYLFTILFDFLTEK